MLRSIKLGLLVSLIGVSSLGAFIIPHERPKRFDSPDTSSSQSSAEQSPAAGSFQYNFLNWVADKVKGFVSSPKAWGVVLTGVAVWQVKRSWDRKPNVFDSVKKFATWANQFREGLLLVSPTKVIEFRYKIFLAKSNQIFDSEKLLSSTICRDEPDFQSAALSAPFSVENEYIQDVIRQRIAKFRKVFLAIGSRLKKKKIFTYETDGSFKALQDPENFFQESYVDWLDGEPSNRPIMKFQSCKKMIQLLQNEVALLDTHLKRIWDRLELGEESILDNAKTAEDLECVQIPLVKDVLVKGLEKREQAKALIQVIGFYESFKRPLEGGVD